MVEGSEQKGAVSSSRRGIYDGFEAFRTPTLEDYHRVLVEGMVVPDANVLLNLYRYTDHARTDLLSVIERLSDRLWIPHQTLVEFWRNRGSVLRDPRDTQSVRQELSGQREKVALVLRTWANRVSLPHERATQLIEELGKGFDAALEEVERFNDPAAAESARDTAKDAILTRLEELLRGRVGDPFDQASYEKALAEGMRRVEAEEPPGYMDKDKDATAAGDYLVWEQVLVEAQCRGCDVAFVTADVKEDWWRREGGEVRGPRPELVAELTSRAGTRLFMLRPTRLLELAPEALEVSVEDASVEVADRVDRLASQRASRSGGWNAAAVESLLDQLHEEEAVQATVIEQAALDGGFIEREQVYEIAGYDPARQLKGFTRPVIRISRILRENGLVTEDAVELLVASYDPDSSNPSEAVGFEINAKALSLVESVVERKYETGS